MTARIVPIALAAALALGGCATFRSAPPERNAALRLDRGLAALESGAFRAAFDDLAWVYSRCQGREAGLHAMAALAALELDLRNAGARPATGLDLLGEFLRTPATEDWLRPLAESAFLGHLALGAPHPEPAPQPPADTVPAAASAGPVEDGSTATEPAPGSQVGHARPGHTAGTTRGSHAAAPQRPVRIPVESEPGVRGCGGSVAWGPDSTMALPRLPGPSVADMLMESEQERGMLAFRTDSLQTLVTTLRDQLEATRAELERIRKTLKP